MKAFLFLVCCLGLAVSVAGASEELDPNSSLDELTSPVLDGTGNGKLSLPDLTKFRAELGTMYPKKCCECKTDLGEFETEVKRNLTLLQRGLCDVFYESKCFAVFVPPSRITLLEAQKICDQVGGKLGNVYSRKHFYDIVRLMRSNIGISWTFINMWTGMVIDQQKNFYLSDGQPGPYVQRRPNRPYSPPRPNGGIYVEETASSTDQGMVDNYPDTELRAALCEIQI